MSSYSTYETPSVRVLTIETEQFCALNVVSGSGASAGEKIQQNTTSGNGPIWI